LPAKIRRELDIRIGNRFVLTNQASQVMRDALEAALQGRVPKLPEDIDGARRRALRHTWRGCRGCSSGRES
jgi:hypothetical protein